MSMMEENSQILTTPFHTWHILHFASLQSTNTHLIKNVQYYKPFTCIIAHQQTNGHGKQRRVWHATPGKDLTFSVLIPLRDITEKLWNAITQVIALSVAKTLEGLQIPSCIKWPNDVLVGGKKICGILCVQHNKLVSCHGQEKKEPMLIIGMGLNVNSTKDDLCSIDQPATSVFIERTEPCPINMLLSRVLYTMSECLENLKDKSFAITCEEIQKRWCAHEKKMTLVMGKDQHEGIVCGLNDDASLQFECIHCGKIQVYSGELFDN